MCNQRTFNFCCAHTVTRNVDHVINTTCDPIISICIATTSVAREIVSFVICKVGFDETVVIAVYGAHLARPAVLHAQHAFGYCFGDFCTRLRIQQNRLNTKEGCRCCPRLGCCRARKRGQQVTARFSLPPCVHDGAGSFANNFVVPIPCFWVDGLTHCSQNLQG